MFTLLLFAQRTEKASIASALALAWSSVNFIIFT